MSTVWLVGSPCDWLDEFAGILSGFFGLRRIAGLKSFGRLIALGEIPVDIPFHCIVSLTDQDTPMTVHTALSRFLLENQPSQICIIGQTSEDQRKVAENHKIACLGVPSEMVQTAKLIRSLMRMGSPRKVTLTDDFIRVGDIEVNRSRACMRIMATGVEEPLTPKEIRILQVLSSSVNQSIGRDELVTKVWAGMRVSASTVDSHMSRLRKKIEQSFECRLETKYGSGWVLSIDSQDYR